MVPALLLAAALSSASPPPACDPSCERLRAESLLRSGDARAAVASLRQAVERHPDSRELRLLLARAYLLEDNLFWAERVLRAARERWPDEPELRAWLAAVHLRQADPALVADDLEEALRPDGGPEAARWWLLEGYRASLEERLGDLLAALERAREAGALWPEDRRPWIGLQRRADPWWAPPVGGSLEVALGHTSDALAGSPTDPGKSGTGSALAELEGSLRWTPSGGGSPRPAMELDLRGSGIEEDEYRDLSSLEAGVRLGVQRARGGRRWLAGYRAEGLWLDQRPSLFAEAHRLEAELESRSGLLVLAGGGRRTYRDDRRTRWEADLAVGGPWRPFGGAPVVVGATVRISDATSPAYDLRGASVAAAMRTGLGRRLELRVAAAVSFDDYPHSGGDEGRLVFGTDERRRDLLGKVTLGLWLGPWRGLEPGLEWRLARRDSTADDAPGFDFGYEESRVTVRVRWRFDGVPGLRRAAPGDDHVPLDWGLEADEGLARERLLDLLRRDEELRRSSTCALP